MTFAYFQVLDGPLRGQNLPITSTDLSLGRQADLQLGGYEGVSRLHARLTWDGTHFCVEDQGSTNGVLVDGHATKRATLSDGSHLKLGDFSATLRIPSGGPQWTDTAPALVPVHSPTPVPLQRTAPGTNSGALSASGALSSSGALSARAGSLWSKLPGGRVGRGAIAATLVLIAVGTLVTSRTPAPSGRPDFTPEVPVTSGRSALDELFTPGGTAPDGTLPGETAPGETPPGESPSSVLKREPGDKASAIRAAQDATVLIVSRNGRRVGFGSGFLTSGGIIVTNEHVVMDDGKVQPCVVVFHCGTPRQYKVDIGVERIRVAPDSEDDGGFRGDLAFLTLEAPVSSAAPLGFGRAEASSETDEVYVTGFPLGIGTLTPGKKLPSVSVKPARIERLQREEDRVHPVSVIQLGGTITHGNSGGPVINAAGEVIGVISRGADGTGMVYAIPASYVQSQLTL